MQSRILSVSFHFCDCGGMGFDIPLLSEVVDTQQWFLFELTVQIVW